MKYFLFYIKKKLDYKIFKEMTTKNIILVFEKLNMIRSSGMQDIFYEDEIFEFIKILQLPKAKSNNVFEVHLT